MRKFFFLVLLLILPVQFAWAAATGYCRHETGQAVSHFGHHEHQHRAAQEGVSTDSKVPPSSLGVDSDCGVCQVGAAQLVPDARADIAITRAEPPRFVYSARYDSHNPSGPERPDRTVLTPAVRFGGVVVIGAPLLA